MVAAVKMSTELIGIRQLADDWGIGLEGSVFVDSSAAIGMVSRQGCGKMRHVRVGLLWIQERQEEGDFEFRKVAGEENPGDLMTKYLGQKVIDRHMSALYQRFEAGRAKTGLKIT